MAAHGSKRSAKRNRDQARAAALKGVIRKDGRCPVCSRMIALAALANHIATHG